MPTTTGMKGDGFYNSHSSAQRAAMDAFLPWIEEAVAQIALAPGESLHCLDIGTSEGSNAIHAASRIIRRFRTVSNQPVWYFFDDLPTNDFNQLFANLFPDGDPAISEANVFTGAIGGSAYGPLVPPGSLHVATTFNALGFLETKPAAALPHFILPMPPGPCAPREGVGVTENEQIPYRLQAAADLEKFFAARADELVSGGRLLVQVYGRNDKVSTSHGIYDALSDGLLDSVDAGLIPHRVYEDLVFPIYFRTLEELIAPLDENSAFRIEATDTRESPVPFNAALNEAGDANAWAASYTGFLRAFSESILAAALPADLRNAETLDSIYSRIKDRLAADPARYPLRFISIGALLCKK
jgi:hypothetical protein